MIGEINAYAAADAVLTVSTKEADLINDLVGDPRLAHAVPDCEDLRARRPTVRRADGHPVHRQLPAPAECRGGRVPLPARSCPGSTARYVATIRSRSSATDSTKTCAVRSAAAPTSAWSAGFRRSSRTCTGPASRSCRCCTARDEAEADPGPDGGTPTVSTSVGIEGLDLRHGDICSLPTIPSTLPAQSSSYSSTKTFGQILTDEDGEIVAAHGREAFARGSWR